MLLPIATSLVKPILVDSHAHLEMEPLFQDADGVVRRARSAGVAAIITVGIDLEDARRALELAERFDDVFVSLGYHPHNAKNAREKALNEMADLATHRKVVAYGEIGLDYFRNYSPRSAQKAVFADQLSIAKSLAKPLVIHLRSAYEEGLTELEKAGPFPAGGVIHCFSGDERDAQRALDLGFHISIPGTITYRKNDKFRAIVSRLPEDRILLETDCPFLAPEPKRGKDNEPAYIVYTAQTVASVRNTSVAVVGQTTTANATRLFGLPLEEAP
ncbi:MAG: TatD family deoxyribonuclease [Deltaproteobacteria bacterium]|nr:TatD family deoxyribonuclease [Deltaproteobacteria bacterium]